MTSLQIINLTDEVSPEVLPQRLYLLQNVLRQELLAAKLGRRRIT
jgi:hypothetical protein